MTQWRITGLEDAFPATPQRGMQEYASIAGESLQYFDNAIWETFVDRVGKENVRCILLDQHLAGGLAFYRMGQWYGGRAVRCAGITGVAIEPGSRGSGACKHLLERVLLELYEEHMPLASLYASTQHLYRSVGFQHSGTRTTYSLAIAALHATKGDRTLPVQRFVQPNFEVLQKIANIRAQRSAGNLERTQGLWERQVDPIGGDTTSTYLLGPAEEPEGYVTLVHGKRQNGHPQTLVATDWIANTPRALRRLIALIRDHRSMCDRFQWNGGPQDALIAASDEAQLEIGMHIHTLNRIVHLESALLSRGFSPIANGEIHLEIDDPLIEENSGKWCLQFSDGVPIIERGGKGTLQISIRELVPLYTGLMTCSQIVALGRATCHDDRQTAVADQVFAGPQPWTCELF